MAARNIWRVHSIIGERCSILYQTIGIILWVHNIRNGYSIVVHCILDLEGKIAGRIIVGLY